MAQNALLLGVKDGKRTIIDQGDPRDIRIKFKTSTSGQGFEAWEVYESSTGRTRKKSWVKEKQVSVVADVATDLEDPASDEDNAPKKRGRPSYK
jgi:hypothetical protein